MGLQGRAMEELSKKLEHAERSEAEVKERLGKNGKTEMIRREVMEKGKK